MADFMWPLGVTVAQQAIGHEDKTKVFTSPATDDSDVVGRPGANRLRMTMSMPVLTTAERHTITALLAALRGKVNKVWIPDLAPRRGAIPASELFANNDFRLGTASWLAQNSTLRAIANGIRVTNTKASATNFATYQSLTVPAGIYAVRGFTTPGTLPLAAGSGVFDPYNVVQANYATGRAGLVSHWGYSDSGAAGSRYPLVADTIGNVATAGTWVDLLYSSYAQCLLVDNAPNSLLWSGDPSNAAWTKAACSITSNALAGVTGAATMDKIVESATLARHSLEQVVTKAAVDQDWTASVDLKAAERTFALVLIGSRTGNNYGYVYVNLSTGAASAGPSVSGTVTNVRWNAVNMGNGIWRVTVTARIPAAITTTNMLSIGTSDTGGGETYTGDGTSGIYVDRMSYAPTPCAVAYALTTTAATSGVSQQGSTLQVKSSQPATPGALVAGDWVEVIQPTYSQMVRLTADLDLDAAGRGVLVFEPQLRYAPADGAAVIVQRPMGRWMLDMDESMVSTSAGLVAAAELVFREAWN